MRFQNTYSKFAKPQLRNQTAKPKLHTQNCCDDSFYGPDNRRANKLVIGIINHEGAEPELRKWYSDDADIRSLPDIEFEIKEFIKSHAVLSISMVDRIIGCPHEEGVDYPDGESCSECLYWRSRDRFTGETIN